MKKDAFRKVTRGFQLHGGDFNLEDLPQTMDLDYIEVAQDILENGVYSENRTGINTYKVFGRFVRFELLNGFPMYTTKKVYSRAAFEETFWFLNGKSNIEDLLAADVHIWDEWANANGDLGPVYGTQWRSREDTQVLMYDDKYYQERNKYFRNPNNGYTLIAFSKKCSVYTRNIDQIGNALHRLRTKPDCRRIIVDGWNPSVTPDDSIPPQKQAEIGKQALPACHTLFQFGSSVIQDNPILADLTNHSIYTIDDQTYIDGIAVAYTEEELKDEANLDAALDEHRNAPINGRYLDLHLHLRSNDYFLGNPFNTIGYAALLQFVAAAVGMIPRNMSFSFGDLHIYENHIEAIQQQGENITRCKHLPRLVTYGVGPTQKADLFNLTADNYKIFGYQSCETIKAAVAV